MKKHSTSRPSTLRLACLVAAFSASLFAHADSFTSTSSASSAGSASSGSVSNSLRGSSNRSTDDAQAAGADYRILGVAKLPDRTGIARVTLQAGDPQQRLVLDLPRAVVDKQGLTPGDIVRARKRVYGLEFARGDTNEAFYLVLAARPVRL